jgi:signal transduction histidine kinase
MPIPLDIVIVEDSAADADLLVAMLKKNGFAPKWKRVDSEADFRASLGPNVQVVFSDFAVPGFSTMVALEVLHESKLDIPFIIVSGTIGEERAVESMKAGATDYVLKDRLDRLGPVVKRALREIQERAERRRLEAQIIEAQKMEVVGHLAGGVAHDFNNILGVIIGYSHLMTPELKSDSLAYKCAEEIRQAADRAVALTRQLLIFSRKQTVQPVVLQLNDVVKDLDKMLHRLIGENVELTVKPGVETGRIKADSGQIGQVLMNLAVNARDAMPDGGQLTIEMQNVRLDEAFVQNHPGTAVAEYVLLTVTDTGIGMSDDVKAHLFEPLFTTKPKGKGTGLGLATCHTIVRQCGGCIEVQSELGKGAAFKIYLPQVDQPVAAKEQPSESKPLPRGKETILLVEDEPSVRHLACSILTAQGYNVLSANNGQEGLRVARECDGGPIRLVITDIVMPHMNGNVMAEWLRASYPHLNVLYTSGYTDDAVLQAEELESGSAFLPKPYTPSALTHKVRELLDNANAK